MTTTNGGGTVHTWGWNPLLGSKSNVMGHTGILKGKRTSENFQVLWHFLLFYEMFASVIYIYQCNEVEYIFTMGL